MKVVEIFKSIEGEGKRAGLPCTFIRLFGCNLRCRYCDTKYGWSSEYADDAKEMSIEQIVEEAVKIGVPHITITGGEPLIHDDLFLLLSELAKRNFWVNVETNGTMLPKCHTSPNIFYTMDYKTNASGMSDKMNMEAIQTLQSKDVLKFVVGSIEDCKQAKDIIDRIRPEASIYFSPVFGEIKPKEIVEFLLSNEMYTCHVQMQLHKIIWPADMRGV